jgi:hypothetical protein
MNTKKMKVLSILIQDISLNRYTIPRGEEYIFGRIVEEESWQLQSLKIQQERRLLSLNIEKKINANINKTSLTKIITYKDSYIKSVENIGSILNLMNEKYGDFDEIKDPIILRSIALLLIEKDFMYESMFSDKHIPVDLFTPLIREFMEAYPEFNEQLGNFLITYTQMYENWPQKPFVPNI